MVRGNIGEQGRGHKSARPVNFVTSVMAVRSSGDGARHPPHHLVPGGNRGQRPHIRGRVIIGTHHDARDLRAGRREEFLENAIQHDNALIRGADLPGVEHARAHRRAGHRRDIGGA